MHEQDMKNMSGLQINLQFHRKTSVQKLSLSQWRIQDFAKGVANAVMRVPGPDGSLKL